MKLSALLFTAFLLPAFQIFSVADVLPVQIHQMGKDVIKIGLLVQYNKSLPARQGLNRQSGDLMRKVVLMAISLGIKTK